MSLLSALRASASGLTAQRLRMDVLANNIANAGTTRTPAGGAYRREQVVFTPRAQQPAFGPLPGLAGRRGASFSLQGFSSRDAGGVQVAAIVEDPTPPRLMYEPGHPDANDAGMVEYPNVDVAREMVDMMAATRAYEANVTVLGALKNMALKALEIGR